MEWLGQKVAMKATVDGLQSMTVAEHFLFDDETDDECYVSEIKDAKYDAVSAEEVAAQQTHLTSVQCQWLQQ
eukprot:5346213-Ditylum_brightwellii.AAC.1